MTKVVVCFDDEEGRLEGDSSMDPAFTVPYVEGMTVSELRESYLKTLMKEWGEEEHYNSVAEFAEYNCMNVTGGWVIDKKTHDLLMGGEWDCGSDSALYRMIHHVKSQIQSAAELTIE